MREFTGIEIRKSLVDANLPIELIGAVLFGSHVKKTHVSESDYDLLIVADAIHAKLHQIKKVLPYAPFNILLLTRSEVISNFKNHNPLFLDIAVEGRIIFDKEVLLAKLVDETRKYIRKKGIKKINDGWIFPVVKGAPTYL